MSTQDKIKAYRFLNGSILKWIAIITMVCDHFNKSVMYYFTHNYPSKFVYFISDCLSFLGTMAFPLFAFLLVEGFMHTRNRRRYLIRLLIFAVISEIPYDLFVTGRFFGNGGQNIFWSLALCFATIWIIDVVRTKTKFWGFLVVPITLVSVIISAFADVDFNIYCVLVVVALYLCYPKYLLGSAIAYVFLIKVYTCFPSFILINLYNGKKGKQMKYLFYMIYPVHLLIFGLFRYFSGY